jgi:hypothetical protein
MMWFMRWKAWFGISLIAGSFVLLPFVGANMIIDGWAEIRAFNGHGLAGIAVPTSVNCDPPSSPCIWDGNFTSDDGTLHLSSVTLSDGGWEVGKPTAARYERRDLLIGALVYRPHGSRQWIIGIWGLLTGAILEVITVMPLALSAPGWMARRRARRGRAPTAHVESNGQSHGRHGSFEAHRS